MDHAAIIAALGGASHLAATLGTTPRVVFRWASGRAIPPTRWLRICELARQKGVPDVTLETLVRGYYPAKLLPRTRAARLRARARRPRPAEEERAAAA